MASKYLYEMANGSPSTFRNLILDEGDVEFLKRFNIEFTTAENYYVVNCSKLKELFGNC